MKIMRHKYILSLFSVFIFFSCKQNSRSAKEPVTGIFAENAALKTATEKINNKPEDARLYYERGMLLHSLKEDSLALNDFKNAVRLDSNKAEYFSAIGDLLFEHKDLSGSVVWIRKALELNPSDPKARLKVAKMLVYSRDYANAFTEINKVLRADAMSPEAYFLKGMIYKDLSDSSAKALSSFLTAVQIQPDYKEALFQLGLLYDKANDSVALLYYENAYKTDTKDATALYAKGMYYQTRERYEEAKREYRRILESDKAYSDAYFNLGYLLMQQDSLEDAIRQFSAVLVLEPTHAGAYYNRGLCHEVLEQKNEAIADYKQALIFSKEYKEAQQALKRVGG